MLPLETPALISLLLLGAYMESALAKHESLWENCQEDCLQERKQKKEVYGEANGNDCCTCQSTFMVCQPCELSAKVNETVILPCLFNFSFGETYQDIEVSWRLNSFHSTVFFFTYTKTRVYLHPEYYGRISLVRDPMKSYDASIHISDLREYDSAVYFCHVTVKNARGRKAWQNICGTNLTVTNALAILPEVNNTLIWIVIGIFVVKAAVFLGLVILLVTRKETIHGPAS